MEVRSQISFRRGRTSFYPSSACPYQLRGSLSRHYGTLCLSSWNSFRVPHRLSTPPPSATEERPASKRSRSPTRFVLDLLSPPPFKSHFHAKLAIFTLSPRPIRARNFEPRNWTAVIYARSEIFHQLSATDFRVGSMNEVVFQEVDPATMMFLGKSFFFVSVS